MKQNCAKIIGIGTYLPPKILTNSDFEKIVETSDEWIFSRTGMKERRVADQDQFTSDMALEAAKAALANANCSPGTIDLVLVATMTPDFISPSSAAIVQSAIGAQNAAAMDLQAACSGFLYALSTAKAFVESGIYQNVLVIAAEKMSAFLDYEDRSTCVLFGDGAAAAIVSAAGDGFDIDSVYLGADGSLSDLLTIPAGGSRLPASEQTIANKQHFLQMSGKEIFKHAVRRMEQAANSCLSSCHKKIEDISCIIPHQANLRIINSLAKQMGISQDKVYKESLSRYGNTSAASVLIALHDFLKSTQIQVGDCLLLITFGGGLTYGAAVLTKN